MYMHQGTDVHDSFLILMQTPDVGMSMCALAEKERAAALRPGLRAVTPLKQERALVIHQFSQLSLLVFVAATFLGPRCTTLDFAPPPRAY